ncbi:MAG TPA: hypothetical protein DCF70_01810 [Treponema sp.]|nr:hypothetical protein [Treponema sp.]
MKQINKLVLTSLAFLAVSLVGATFVSCSNDDDSAASNTSPISEETTMGSLKVGSTVTYAGSEYLVTKNSFYDETAPRAISRTVLEPSKTDEDIAANQEYIKKYLTKEFRGSLLTEETGITDYIEIFSKVQKKETSAKGLGSLEDIYLILDEEGNKIAEVKQKWQSDAFSKFFFGLTTTDEQTEKFNTFTEDELREYDPHTIMITTFPSDVSSKIQVEICYNYYEDAADSESEHSKQINLDSLYFRTEYLNWMENVKESLKSASRKQVNTDGKIAYTLTDALSGSAFFSLDTYSDHFVLTAKGDGNVNGSTNTSDYKNMLKVKYFGSQPIYAQCTLGETKTSRTTIYSTKNSGTYTSDFSGSVTIIEQTSADEGSTWTTESQIEVEVSKIEENCDCMSVSSETTTVTVGNEEITIPASMTYRAHFAKNEDGSYPVLDKYTTVTCYPVYDEEKSRIIYKVTDKTIEDYIAAYLADFSTLKAE